MTDNLWEFWRSFSPKTFAFHIILILHETLEVTKRRHRHKWRSYRHEGGHFSLFTLNLSLSMCHSGHVTLYMTVQTCCLDMYSQHITLDIALLKRHSQNITHDISLSTCHSGTATLDLTCHSLFITLFIILLTYHSTWHSQLLILDMSLLTQETHMKGVWTMRGMNLSFSSCHSTFCSWHVTIYLTCYGTTQDHTRSI